TDPAEAPAAAPADMATAPARKAAKRAPRKTAKKSATPPRDPQSAQVAPVQAGPAQAGPAQVGPAQVGPAPVDQGAEPDPVTAPAVQNFGLLFQPPAPTEAPGRRRATAPVAAPHPEQVPAPQP